MSKPVAGRRAFEAMGRRAQSAGLPLDYGWRERFAWPEWANEAYTYAYLTNRRWRAS